MQFYELGEYAKTHQNRLFILMDWGFSNQLLVLTEGKIKKEEAFARVLAAGRDNEKKVAMRRYIMRPGAVLVFHAQKYELFPMLDTFNCSLEKYGLNARLKKTFYQRDGQPVYLLYEMLPSPAG